MSCAPAFEFEPDPPDKSAVQARVPAGITSKMDLLLALQAALRFPSYFGRNWDALDECLRDLSWLPAGSVGLFHEDVPLVNDRASLQTYVSILRRAMDTWAATKERQLFVVFPPGAEDLIRGTEPNRRQT
jgi:RNAse (barnase) inhibitor barstar